MRSAGCGKRVNSRSCFCHLNAINFKTWRRVGRRLLPQIHKNLFRSEQIPRGKLNPNLKPKPKEQMKKIIYLLSRGVIALLATHLTGAAQASSHMDAPLITRDPAANTTD